MNQSTDAEPRPTAIDAQHDDESPYRVYGLDGNVSDWCLNSFERTLDMKAEHPPPPEVQETEAEVHTVRGEHWSAGPTDCTTYRRRGHHRESRLPTVGFRLVHPLGDR